jgi:hypothetical protein
LESTLGCAFQAKQEVFGFARAADPLFFFQPTSQLLLLLYIPPSPSRFFFFLILSCQTLYPVSAEFTSISRVG